MKMISITILRLKHGSDKIFIETDLPGATYPYTDALDLEFTVARGAGEEYCKKHFPDVPIKHIL